MAELLEQVAEVILEQLRPEFPFEQLCLTQSGVYFAGLRLSHCILWLDFYPNYINFWVYDAETADDEGGSFSYADPGLLDQLRACLRHEWVFLRHKLASL